MAKKTAKKTAKKAPKPAHKSTAISTREPGGKFGKGNKGGPGGKRPGAGRKPGPVRANLEQVLAQTKISETVDPKVLKGLKLTAYGSKTPLEIAHQNLLLALCDNVNGAPTEFAIDASKIIFDRFYGKSKQMIDIGLSTRDLGRKLERAEGDLLRSIGQAVAEGVSDV